METVYLPKGPFAQNHEEVEVLSPNHVLAPHVVGHQGILHTVQFGVQSRFRLRFRFQC